MLTLPVLHPGWAMAGFDLTKVPMSADTSVTSKSARHLGQLMSRLTAIEAVRAATLVPVVRNAFMTGHPCKLNHHGVSISLHALQKATYVAWGSLDGHERLQDLLVENTICVFFSVVGKVPVDESECGLRDCGAAEGHV